MLQILLNILFFQVSLSAESYNILFQHCNKILPFFISPLYLLWSQSVAVRFYNKLYKWAWGPLLTLRFCTIALGARAALKSASPIGSALGIDLSSAASFAQIFWASLKVRSLGGILLALAQVTIQEAKWCPMRKGISYLDIRISTISCEHVQSRFNSSMALSGLILSAFKIRSNRSTTALVLESISSVPRIRPSAMPAGILCALNAAPVARPNMVPHWVLQLLLPLRYYLGNTLHHLHLEHIIEATTMHASIFFIVSSLLLVYS